MKLDSRRRGSSVLGMAILIFVLVSSCGVVLQQSLEMYREQVLAERRHQERAGLEAAVALLVRDPLAGPGTVEGATFSATFGEVRVDGDVAVRRVSVTVLGRDGGPVHEGSKTVAFEKRDGRWAWAGVQP